MRVKLLALDALDRGVKQAEVARELKVNGSTISRLKKSPRAIREWEKTRGRRFNPGSSVREAAHAVAEAVQDPPPATPEVDQSDTPSELLLRRGPPPGFKRDVSILARLAEKLATGLPEKWACRRVGLSHATWRSWVNKAKSGTPGYADWVDVLLQVQAIGVEALFARVRSGEPGWQSSCWVLERLWPEDFGKRDHVTVEEVSPAAALDTTALKGVLAAARAAKEEREQLECA